MRGVFVLLLAASTAASPICASQPHRSWCNTRLSFHARAELLAKELSSAEAASLLGNTAAAVLRLGLPAYQWWNEGLHGIAHSPGVNFSDPTACATSFPQVILTASSMNTSLFSSIGEAIGIEGRAFHSAHHAGLTFWTPNLNVAVDPRWGRLQETPGEDPLLNARYGVAFVTGIQGPDPQKNLLASACVKHFDAYHLETNRLSFDGIVSDFDMHNTYLVPFREALPHASCTMCAYVAINGVPSCANPLLLTHYIDEWRFQGYITSDCGATEFVETMHHYVDTNASCVNVTLSSGMDIDCGDFLPKYAAQALENGQVARETVNRALRNLFIVQMRLGLFDGGPYDKIRPGSINTAKHSELAYQAAVQSMVLLQHNHLPLISSSRGVALIGPSANATTTMQGNYFGVACELVSPLEALSNAIPVHYARGCDISSRDMSGFAGALGAVDKSESVILIMGLDQSQEREGLDRTSLCLPGVQTELIDQVIKRAAGKPVVLVLMSGGPLDVSRWVGSSNVDILWAGYPGQAGGKAVADILLGKQSPSGVLTQTWYRESFAKQVKLQDMRMRPTGDYPGRTYRYYTGTPIFRFGHGLSFADFETTWETSSRVRVRNKSKFPAAKTVLKMGAKDGHLIDFRKIWVEPGDDVFVYF